MRKLVLGLATSTVLLGASTLHFWRELSLERARHAVVVPAPADTATAPVARVASQPATAPTSTPPPESGNAGRSRPRTRAEAIVDARKQMAATAPAFLASLADPRQRAHMIAENVRMARHYSPGMQRYLGLDDETYDRFLETVAELDLAGNEAMSRCVLDPGCPFPDFDRSLLRAQRRNALSQFGADIAEKYDFYSRSAAERQLVTEFRGRLDDATRLTDGQTDKLVRALLEAHQQIQEELVKNPGNIGSMNGVAYAEMDVGVAADASVDHSDDIARYNRRLRDGAASVLNAAQLAAFVQMQEEALEESRQMRRARRGTAGPSN